MQFNLDRFDKVYADLEERFGQEKVEYKLYSAMRQFLLAQNEEKKELAERYIRSFSLQSIEYRDQFWS